MSRRHPSAPSTPQNPTQAVWCIYATFFFEISKRNRNRTSRSPHHRSRRRSRPGRSRASSIRRGKAGRRGSTRPCCPHSFPLLLDPRRWPLAVVVVVVVGTPLLILVMVVCRRLWSDLVRIRSRRRRGGIASTSQTQVYDITDSTPMCVGKREAQAFLLTRGIW